MNAPTPITSRLANRIFMLRSERGLSLDQLAHASGISRATLSRIENADVSPTADTLAAICAAFDLPISKLIAMAEDRFVAHVPFDDQTEWEDPETGFTRRAISPSAAQLSGFADEIHLPPDTQHAPAPHSKQGQEHHLIILDGAMIVRTGSETHTLTTGDCLRYIEDGTTSFHTAQARGARFIQFCV